MSLQVLSKTTEYMLFISVRETFERIRKYLASLLNKSGTFSHFKNNIQLYLESLLLKISMKVFPDSEVIMFQGFKKLLTFHVS